MSLYAVDAVLILDNEGGRVLAKYFQPPHESASEHGMLAARTPAELLAFEKGLFAKTNKLNSDVLIYDSQLVVYKQVVDFTIYLVGSLEESEGMLYQALVGLRDAIDIVLKHSVDKRTILEKYDLVALAVDETIDDGIILEVDPMVIASRVSKAPKDEPSLNSIDLSEQGLRNAYLLARGRLTERFKQQFQ